MSGRASRSRAWIALAAAVVVALTARLGFWQLDRAAQKEAIGAQLQLQSRRAPLDESDLLRLASSQDASRETGRPVRLRGDWVAGSTVWLENRQMGGRPGFYAVSVLRLPGSSVGVLVQQGWVARDPSDRLRVPDLPLPSGPVVVQGRMAPPPSRLYDFGGVDTGRLRQNLDVDQRSRELGLPLLPASVLETAAPGDQPSDGLARDWPVPTVDVHKHHGYAFQWFALSFLTAGLYVWFQVIRPRRRR